MIPVIFVFFVLWVSVDITTFVVLLQRHGFQGTVRLVKELFTRKPD